MKDFLASLSTALAIVLLIPTGLILVSWNALPGERLYGLKRGLESVAFALTKDTPIATAFSLKFTDRRFIEANTLLAQKGSTVGYTLLVAEAQKTKDVIVEKNDSQSAAQLIAKIDTYEKTIDEKKLALAAPTPFIPPAPVRTPLTVDKTPAPPGTVVVTQTSQTPPPATGTQTSNQQTIDDLDETKKDLEKIKDELKKGPSENASERAKEKHDENSRKER